MSVAGPLKALCKSHEYHSTGRSPRITALFVNIFAVVLMGTPHRGSDQTSWAPIATNLAKVLTTDHNDRIVQALSRGSEVLEGLRDSFAGTLNHLLIYIFFRGAKCVQERKGKQRSLQVLRCS
jgi:hypothetical protein